MPLPTSSTNRPFFLSSFLSAFRARSRSTYSKPTTSTSPTPPTSTFPSLTAQTSTTASARSITSTSTSQPRPTNMQPKPPSPNPQPASNSTALSSIALSPPRSLNSTARQASSPTHSPPSSSPFRRQPTSPPPRRRGSDVSSEEGFREVLGGEKWYVGGRTASGEERFYRLGIVRRERSLDGGSIDQLSL